METFRAPCSLSFISFISFHLDIVVSLTSVRPFKMCYLSKPALLF